MILDHLIVTKVFKNNLKLLIKMNHKENTQKLLEELKASSSPISVRNLKRRLNLPRKYVIWLLRSNPETFERAHPIEVGSGKWFPNEQYFLPEYKGRMKVKGLVNVWKIRKSVK